ncbi:MAG: hypothetical protein HC934_14215 [Acaryochloridaceae cyanobacterium SU_2_1]|nr:hypothetical protein [Acaryochloridaceae cyanobacterium SU_2_1]
MSTVPECSEQLFAVVDAVLANSSTKPSPRTVLETLLTIEKRAQFLSSHSFNSFVGTWRLCFVTLRGKPHQRAGQIIGRGFYVPQWVTLQIIYTPITETEEGSPTSPSAGQIANQVCWGGLSVSLTGPARCEPKKNIMAFDFTRMVVTTWGKNLHHGFIRGGQVSEKTSGLSQ